MKLRNLLFVFALLGAVLFTGCEEEEEPAQTLTAFVIGEWESQEVMLGETSAKFLIDVETGHYTMTLVTAEASMELPDRGYTVDDAKSIITIERPTFPGEEPSDDLIPFKVTWMEGGSTMTWLPVDPLEDDGPPTIVWNRMTGM